MSLNKLIKEKEEEFEEIFRQGDKSWQINYENDLKAFLRSALEELDNSWRKRIEGMKKKGNPEFETNQDFGYNQALSDLLKEE